jgi:hypothetical protein
MAARRVLESDETIDLLLTDIVMPNGARRLRQGLGVVLVSGYHRDDNWADDQSGLIFREKPCRPTELADTIADVLSNGGR